MFKKIKLSKVLLVLIFASTVNSDFHACEELSRVAIVKIVLPIAFKAAGKFVTCVLVPYIVEDKVNKVLERTPLKPFWRMAIAGGIAVGTDLACRGLVFKSSVSKATFAEIFGLHLGVPCVSYVGGFVLTIRQDRRQRGNALPQASREILEILRYLVRHLGVVIEPPINEAPVVVPQGQQLPVLAQLQRDNLVLVLIVIVPATNLEECSICQSEQIEENKVRICDCRLRGEELTDGHAICATCASTCIVNVDNPINIIRNALPMCSICRANLLPTVVTAVLALLSGATPDQAIAVAQDPFTVDGVTQRRGASVREMIDFIRGRLPEVQGDLPYGDFEKTLKGIQF